MAAKNTEAEITATHTEDASLHAQSHDIKLVDQKDIIEKKVEQLFKFPHLEANRSYLASQDI